MSSNIHVLRPSVKENVKHQGHKIKVNPYYGCTHRCLFCPANDGYLQKKVFDEFRNKGDLFVVDNIIDHIEAYIKSSDKDDNEEPTVHLSPVTDPFQPIERKYKLSHKIMEYCEQKGIAMAICTKAGVPENVIPYLKANPKSFVQISLPSINEAKRRYIVRGGGLTVEQSIENIRTLTENSIPVIIRMDPIFPYINDDMEEFEEMLIIAKSVGVNYILSSVADIYHGALERESNYLEEFQKGLSTKYRNLYTNEIEGRFHASIEYRETIFSRMSDLCKIHGMSFGITWEPDLNGNSINNKYSHGAQEFINKLR